MASSSTARTGGGPPVVSFDHVSLAFDDNVVLRDLSFTVHAGRMKILLGISGAGKSVVLKLALGLLKPDSGTIHVNGERIDDLPEPQLMRIRAGIGMLFQEGALFDSLTVADNVGYPLHEDLGRKDGEVDDRVREVLQIIGLDGYGDRMPSELSGGQRRRVALARAISAKPGLLLIDEPTSGLDPIIAKTIDAEIIKLRDLEGVTSIIVTHQLQDAFYVATHTATRREERIVIEPATSNQADQVEFMMLKEGRIQFEGSLTELQSSTDPYIRRFLS